MTTDKKLIEILNKHWKGFMEFDDHTEDEKERRKKEYNMLELYTMLVDAYNLGVDETIEKIKDCFSEDVKILLKLKI